MMTPNVIRDALHAHRPFRIKMVSGATYKVPHPDFAMLTRSGRTLIVNTDKDHVEWLDVLMIESIQQSEASLQK
jgi:hypothetical protein